MSTKQICRGLRKANILISQLKKSQNSPRQLSTAPSLVGFNNYEAGVKNFNLITPHFYNFATDVIDKWAAEENVSDIYFMYNIP